MRPITKIFLLIVVAFVVFLIWPRTPNLKGFDPNAMAKLQVQEWQAEKAGRPMAALWARYQIYTSQYHFSPVSAFRMAQSEGASISGIKPVDPNVEATEDPHIVLGFTEKYSSMKQALGASFDADSVARDEYSWRTLLVEKSPAEQLVTPVSNMLAGLYGGAPADFADVATNLVNAQGYVFGTVSAPADTDAAHAADAAAQDAFKLLKEIAAAPAPAAPASDAAN